jgi:predicted ribosomally synthesized peptide with SipW-like signal peptide
MNKRILASILVIGLVAAGIGSTTTALFNDTETSNDNEFTAGELDLQVDWNESYNGEHIETQEMTDNPGAIFDFEDIKPGDHGEATVSLHLEDNPGWIWMTFNQTSNLENGCTEPESEVDNSCNDPGQGEGELGEHLEFTIWADDGDNTLQDDEEVIFEGTAHELSEQSELSDGLLLDSNPETEEVEAFPGEETKYVGVKWNVPLETGNEIQGDSKTFDIGFYTEQERHNPQEPQEPEDPDNETEEPEEPVNFSPKFTGCSSVIIYTDNGADSYEIVRDNGGELEKVQVTASEANETFESDHPQFGSGEEGVIGYKFDYDKTVGLIGEDSFINANYNLENMSCSNSSGIADGVEFDWSSEFDGETYYQVDLVGGEPITDLSESTYSSEGRMQRYMHGGPDNPVDNESEPDMVKTGTGGPDCVDSEPFEVDTEQNTVTVDFQVNNITPECATGTELSLVSYEKPHPGWIADRADEQKIYDNKTRRYDPGNHSMTVDIPDVNKDESESPEFTATQGDETVEITPIEGEESVEDFYDFRLPDRYDNEANRNATNGASYGSGPYYGSAGTEDLQQGDASLMFLYEGPEGLSFVVVHEGEGSNDGGSATFEITDLNGNGEWVVKDDLYLNDDGTIASSNYDRWNTSSNPQTIDWTWGGGGSDGGAYTLSEDFEFTITPSFNEDSELYEQHYNGDVDEWQVLSGDRNSPDRTTLNMTQEVTVAAN